MATILDTLKKGTEYLQKYGIDEARLNMEHLIAHVLRVDRMQLYLDFDRPLSEATLDSLRDLTKRRSRGEPLQHLLGSVEFCDLEFKTDARALVPRPETEELAHRLIAREWPEHLRILDMGCGSGIIGLSLAHHLREKSPRTVLADISADALALARENAQALGLAHEVEFVETDLFAAVHGEFDLIAANLPYIPDREHTELSREVLRDPAQALYGGETGTELIERFLPAAFERLREGGILALEYGIGQAEHLRTLAENIGYDRVTVESDLSGIERFLFAVKST